MRTMEHAVPLFFFFFNLFFNWKKIAYSVVLPCTVQQQKLDSSCLGLEFVYSFTAGVVFFLLVRFCLRPNPVSLGPKVHWLVTKSCPTLL